MLSNSITQPLATKALQDSCTTCGMQAPTKWVSLYQNIGMVFMRQTAEINGHLCRRCIGAYFRSYTLTTLFLGWWGVISFVFTPFILVNNVVRYLAALSLPEPSLAAMNTPLQTTATTIRVSTHSLKFKLIYGTIAWGVAAILIASSSVNYMEKHAPALNAKLHTGEISGDSDAEYLWTKVSEDMSHLNADPKSKGWTGVRAEFLSQEPYLSDLKTQNDKFQKLATTERNANLGANDLCERLALDKLAPAMRDYTQALDATFGIFKSNENPTQAAISSLHSWGKKEDDAVRRLKAYFSEAEAMGCNK